MSLIPVEATKDKPIFSCPECESENVNLLEPVCNDCGANSKDYPKAVEWIQCPKCETRSIEVHATSQHKKSEFRVDCSNCEYTAELMWTD